MLLLLLMLLLAVVACCLAGCLFTAKSNKQQAANSDCRLKWTPARLPSQLGSWAAEQLQFLGTLPLVSLRFASSFVWPLTLLPYRLCHLQFRTSFSFCSSSHYIIASLRGRGKKGCNFCLLPKDLLLTSEFISCLSFVQFTAMGIKYLNNIVLYHICYKSCVLFLVPFLLKKREISHIILFISTRAMVFLNRSYWIRSISIKLAQIC